MRMLALASRNVKEILRDPLNLAFGLGFPIVLILLLTAIGASAPVETFKIGQLAPAIAVFGLSFLTLFSATLLSRDRGTALFARLYTTPLTSLDFILAYTLPILPIAVAQSILCYAVAVLLGLTLSVNLLLAIAVTLPTALFFIALGLLCGSLLSDKQVGGICGALLTNLSAWLSGGWFDLSLIGGALERIAYLLPFAHAVDLGRAALAGDISALLPHLIWVLGYAIGTGGAAVVVFLRTSRA